MRALDRDIYLLDLVSRLAGKTSELARLTAKLASTVETQQAEIRELQQRRAS